MLQNSMIQIPFHLMSSRLEIEITSKIDDLSHTWRAVGAKQPKGNIKSSLLPSGVKVGETFRVEADFLLDGIEIVSVLPPKAKRDEPVFLDIIGSGKSEGGVTTSLVGKRSKRKNDSKKKGKRDFKNVKPKAREDKRNVPKAKPKKRPKNFQPRRGKRLKPKKIHRNGFIEDLPELHKPLAIEITNSSIPKLREKLSKMDLPAGFSDPILDYAQELNTGLKTAEWLDRAEAIEKDMPSVDLQDFRSVVAASENWARSGKAIELKDKLEAGLKKRIETEQQQWLKIIRDALQEEKLVRALNFSSRPPKAGAQLPEDTSNLLVKQASEALNSETNPDRWAVVAEAVAYSPVRLKVQPIALPSRMNDNLSKMIVKHSERFPAMAALQESKN